MVATIARSGPGFTTSNVRTYDVWGGVRTGASTAGPKGRYVANLGHVQDDESGLIYMRARYYEPESGRFISEDPARYGSNWFVYCHADSVNNVDSDGCVSMRIAKNAAVLGWFLYLTVVLFGSAQAGHEITAQRAIAYVIKALLGVLTGAGLEFFERTFSLTSKVSKIFTDSKSKVGLGTRLLGFQMFYIAYGILCALLLDMLFLGLDFMDAPSLGDFIE